MPHNSLPSALFVVRQEGGQFEYLTFAQWKHEIDAGVPIFGVRIAGLMLLRDRIAARLGSDPVFVVRAPA